MFGIGPVASGDRSNGPIPMTVIGIGNGASACETVQSNTPHAAEHAALQRLLDDREACIADLRGRLDASEAERRQLSERLHGLLTHRQAGSVPAVPAPRGAVVAALVPVRGLPSVR